MKKYKTQEDLAAALQAPFPAEDVEWRIQQAGGLAEGSRSWAMVLAYITNRAIMARLDDVFGPMNWRNQFNPLMELDQLSGFNCTLFAGCEVDGKPAETIKHDGAPCTHIEPIKGGMSDAMKRAAVQLGIGRYLYGLDAGFADVSMTKVTRDGYRRAWVKDTKTKKEYNIWWCPPALPEWALPAKAGLAPEGSAAAGDDMAEIVPIK